MSFIGAVTKSHSDEQAEGDPTKSRDNTDSSLDGEDMQNKIMDKLCLVLEFCPRGSLYDCLIKRKEKVFRYFHALHQTEVFNYLLISDSFYYFGKNGKGRSKWHPSL